MKQKTTRRKFTAEFKAKVALDAIKEQQSLPELSQKYEVSSVMISRWKGEFLANTAILFTNLNETEKSAEDIETLYAQIGKLKVEVDFLKKVSARLEI
ncbi:MAG: transposase [Crocinitomicaceae bacterium]|nr:transposase [Crocinitomicaceae bacterium]